MFIGRCIYLQYYSIFYDYLGWNLAHNENTKRKKKWRKTYYKRIRGTSYIATMLYSTINMKEIQRFEYELNRTHADILFTPNSFSMDCRNSCEHGSPLRAYTIVSYVISTFMYIQNTLIEMYLWYIFFRR